MLWHAIINYPCRHGRRRGYSVQLRLSVRALKGTAWAINSNTNLGTHILYSSRSACIDPEVNSQGHTLMNIVTVTCLLVMHAAATAAGMGLHVNLTAYAF